MSKNNAENVDKIVEITKVKPNSSQPEKVIDEDELQELIESIKEYGMLAPILVENKGDYYEIIAGEKRWQAAKIAGLKEIPVTIREYDENEQVYEGEAMTDLKNLTTNQRDFLADWVAYFQLDWMPGMQMQVDADLNEGKIDESMAKERRDLIQYFYQLSEEAYENYNLSEFGFTSSRAEEHEEDNKDRVKSILESIEEKEKEFLSDFGLDEYASLGEVPEEELEGLDIEDQKKYYDITEFMSAVVNVNDLINAKKSTDDKKELHRIKKEFEMAIHDLRALKGKKNEEASWANSINWSLEDLISICKDAVITVFNAENKDNN